MSTDVLWAPAPEPHAHLDDVLDAFTTLVGGRPDGVWAAPGRVNLVGEHVDYNGGPVLPFAIPHRGLVAARRRDDGLLRLASRQDGSRWEGPVAGLAPGGVPGWAAYAAGVVWALAEVGLVGPHDVPGLDLVVDGRVPLGAGLSSSASLTCAVAVAVAGLAGLPDDDVARRSLAAACVRAENEFAGAPTGGMDQAVSLRARDGAVLLLDCATFDVEHVPVPADAELLVVDTRTHHALTDGQYGGRRSTCERAAGLLGVDRLADLLPGAAVDDAVVLDHVLPRLPDDELRRAVRHVLTEVGRVHEVVAHLRAGTLAGAGPALVASHASMRDDFRISTPELDLVVDSALVAGSPGARMTGGGFGGSAVVLAPPGGSDALAEAVTRAASDAGHRQPQVLRVRPSAPAGRVA
ncbi:galactokinase [Aquipuribacter nitratireducens]|uniref:Galactokinase n=1 Tax=Aquipuribacter nitratireducens TaxID=650104 RepID=A0ABW0GL10_9MICO